jgi:hypothetical protein
MNTAITMLTATITHMITGTAMPDTTMARLAM